ncbi:hypothetical protein CQ12_24810 [Bradyrhizobium jicamae]|uniref:Uncharacterized protein n=1 Tax=Bradyrhizobium jicamae TaxID=280332 RepID=A0A0R3LPS0_9BRAD|nr:hypothetical protein [Bradyrhizobium jicamae]KRR07062.1 hypothetical protein CQ12_24810 [Bradyrhizobium jicamae]
MNRIAGKESGYHAMPHRSMRRRTGGALIAMLSIGCIVLLTSEASARCSARAALQNRLTPKTAPSNAPPAPVTSAFAVPVWRTITVGTFANSFALLSALDAAGCGIGSLAEEILARPAFNVGTTKANVELFAVSAAELGFQTGTVRLAEVYARARQLGFGLAAAEVGPQLRLQYFDQPMGEFLIAMEPIRTWKGDPVILAVANGGAGLVLIGQDGSADAEIPLASHFLFVRSNEAALARAVRGGDEAATLGRR